MGRYTKYLLKYKMKKAVTLIPRALSASYLCLRFPFLYPRNRFTGLHHNNWKLNDKMGKYYKTHTISMNRRDADIYNSLPVNTDLIIYNNTLVVRYWDRRWSKIVYNIMKFLRSTLFQIPYMIPSYTELDAMPCGWRRAFGIQMCKEIKRALLDAGGRKALRAYRIMDIKEKYGELRWYDEGSPEPVHKIIEKYSYISTRTCIVCGRDADYVTTGWISPYCSRHINPDDRPFAQKYMEDIDWYGWKMYKSEDDTSQDD